VEDFSTTKWVVASNEMFGALKKLGVILYQSIYS